MTRLSLLLAAALVAGGCATTEPYDDSAFYDPDPLTGTEPLVETGTFEELEDDEGIFQPDDPRIVAFPVIVDPGAQVQDRGEPIAVDEIEEGQPVRVTYRLEEGSAPRVVRIDVLEQEPLPGTPPRDEPLDVLEPGFPDPSTDRSPLP